MNTNFKNELFHYTGLKGLEGIIKSQSIWATHFAFMNDTAELTTFKNRLVKILKAGLQIDDADDSFAEDMAKWMHDAALGNREASIKPDAEPYIASFCKAGSDEISKHGQLSQWRAYGEEGGYAIVFDRERLVDLIKEENKRWSYASIIAEEVVYSVQQTQFQEKLAEQGRIIIDALQKFRKNPNNPESLEDTYFPFMKCAGFYKHWGFQEENEFRILAIPFNRAIVDRFKDQKLKAKPREFFTREGTPVPCIHLFEGIGDPPRAALPITRIIVGPHRHKENRIRAIENLLEIHSLDIEVSPSDIPFVGY